MGKGKCYVSLNGGLHKHFVYMYSVNCFTHTFHVGWDDQRQLFLVKSHILPLLFIVDFHNSSLLVEIMCSLLVLFRSRSAFL